MLADKCSAETVQLGLAMLHLAFSPGTTVFTAAAAAAAEDKLELFCWDCDGPTASAASTASMAEACASPLAKTLHASWPT